jgi:hypothetical protein
MWFPACDITHLVGLERHAVIGVQLIVRPRDRCDPGSPRLYVSFKLRELLLELS